MLNDRPPESIEMVRLNTPSMYSIRDDSQLLYPDKGSITNCLLEPGLMLHACAMIDEGISFLQSRSKLEWQH